MAIRAAPHVHGPSKHVYYNVLCVLLLLYVVLCLTHALGHCVYVVCVLVLIGGYLLGLWLRDALSVWREANIPLVFSSSENAGGVLREKIFFL